MRSGQVLKDRYRLVERIAAGGMGEVWRAEDLTLQRIVAIKVLHAAFAEDQDFRRRFIREARTLAALNAPGLIDLYDVAEEALDGGQLRSYLVMELVHGRPLSDRLAEHGRLTIPATMAIVAQSAQALSAAHRAGIVHRDVKPANIMVDDDGEVTVIDFGIARVPNHTPLTRAGSVMGTVEYASPEQLRGEDLTGVADVYALGVVAYECLSGQLPFSGDTPTIIAGHLDGVPAPLPEDVPRPVRSVIMRALDKDPANRFASAAEFAEACFSLVGNASPAATRRMVVGHASVPNSPPPTTMAIDYEPVPEQPTDVAKLLRWRTIVTAGITLAVVAVIAGTIGLLSMDWGTGTDGSDGASGSPSPSESPSPQPPDRPSPSRLTNVKTGDCAKVDPGWWLVGSKSALGECADAPVFSFAPQTGDAYQVGYTVGGTSGCLNWRFGDDVVGAGPCEADTAWTFTWRETSGGRDVWQIKSVNNDNFCLAANGERLQAQNCTDNDSQLWYTNAAGKGDPDTE